MRSQKKFFITLIAVCLIGLFIALYFKLNKVGNKLITSQPFETGYTKQFNDWAKSIESNKKAAPDTELKKKKYIDKLVRMSKMAIEDIEFHGKIIDQYGEPVPDVVISYIGSRSLLVGGSGSGVTQSDIDGRVLIDNARGDGLKINKLSKLGYQLPAEPILLNNLKGGIELESSWSNYTKDNPYIFNVWKIEKLSLIHI